MKNWEKGELAFRVKQEIRNNQSMVATINKLNKLGFKRETIRTYYKTFSKGNS